MERDRYLVTQMPFKSYSGRNQTDNRCDSDQFCEREVLQSSDVIKIYKPFDPEDVYVSNSHKLEENSFLFIQLTLFVSIAFILQDTL